jgi:hypothetical protein
MTPGWTATPLFTVDGSVSPVALYLNVKGSACYATPVGSLICLGQIHNGLNVPVEAITVEVRLLSPDGVPLATEEALLSRWVLPAGDSGPYRVLFEQIPEGYARAQIVVASGQVAHDVERRYADLRVTPVSGKFVIDQYQVTLSIRNYSLAPATDLAVTMTLLDEYGRVTGFARVHPAQNLQLSPGEPMAITVKVIPQAPGTVSFDAFVEGWLMWE